MLVDKISDEDYLKKLYWFSIYNENKKFIKIISNKIDLKEHS